MANSLIPKQYAGKPWAKKATNALTSARKRASNATKAQKSPMAVIKSTVPGSVASFGLGYADAKYPTGIPVGGNNISYTEASAILLPLAAVLTRNQTIAQAAAGPLMVSAWAFGQKLGSK